MEHSTAIIKHKNFSQMLGLNSATCKRVTTRSAIIFATVNEIYCLHEAVNVQILGRSPD